MRLDIGTLSLMHEENRVSLTRWEFRFIYRLAKEFPGGVELKRDITMIWPDGEPADFHSVARGNIATMRAKLVNAGIPTFIKTTEPERYRFVYSVSEPIQVAL